MLAFAFLASDGWTQYASSEQTLLAGSDKKDDDEEEEEIVLLQGCEPGFQVLAQSGKKRDKRRGDELLKWTA
jgi:hypothetical protein